MEALRSQTLTIIEGKTVILRKQQRLLKEIAQALFNRALSDESPGQRSRSKKIGEFNKFMAEGKKKLAGLEAECVVLEKLRGVLRTADGTQGSRSG
jgi:hypothetical protein